MNKSYIIAASQSCQRKARGYFAQVTFAVCGPVAISLAISLSFVLSTGPHAQTYIVTLLNSEAPTIYGSAYQDALAKLPSLREWLLAGFDWRFLLMGSVIAISSLYRLKARQILASGILSSFFVLITHDLLFAIHGGLISLAYLFENVLANFFGSIILAFMIISVLVGRSMCIDYAPGPLALRRSAAAAFTVASGALCSVFIYYSALLFYQPLPVKLDVYVDQPVSGFLVAKAKEEIPNDDADDDAPESTSPFRLVHGIVGANAHWRSVEGVLEVQWRAQKIPVIFDAIVELYDGCWHSPASTIQGAAHPLQLKDVKDLSVSFDKGFSEFASIKQERNSGVGLKVASESPVMYWIHRDEASTSATVTQHVVGDTTLTYVDIPEQIAFYIYAPLLVATAKNDLLASRRTLRIRANESDYVVTFEPSRSVSRSTKIPCRPVASPAVFDKTRAALISSNVHAGAIVRLHARTPLDRHYGGGSGDLRVKGDMGSITVGQISDERWARASRGAVEMFSFAGNIISLEIDGAPIPARPIDSYAAFGDFQGSFEESPKLRFVGTAKALWRNRSRLNPTRWERLTWEARLLLLSVFGSLLMMVARSVTVRLKNDCEVRIAE